MVQNKNQVCAKPVPVSVNMLRVILSIVLTVKEVGCPIKPTIPCIHRLFFGKFCIVYDVKYWIARQELKEKVD